MARRTLRARIALTLARWLRGVADLLDASGASTPAPAPAAPDTAAPGSEATDGVPAHWAARLAQGRPPAHWLEQIRRRAPHLLSGRGWQGGPTPLQDHGPRDVELGRTGPQAAAPRPAATRSAGSQGEQAAAEAPHKPEVAPARSSVRLYFPPPKQVETKPVSGPQRPKPVAGSSRRAPRAREPAPVIEPSGPPADAVPAGEREVDTALSRELPDSAAEVPLQPEPSRTSPTEVPPVQTPAVQAGKAPEPPAQGTQQGGLGDPWAQLAWGQQVIDEPGREVASWVPLDARPAGALPESADREITAWPPRIERGPDEPEVSERTAAPVRERRWNALRPVQRASLQPFVRGQVEQARTESVPASSAPGPLSFTGTERVDDSGLPDISSGPEDHWPAMLDPVTWPDQDGDWQAAIRAWRRQQRLDDEQRGRLWNE
jgi:hypothetical protein